MRMNATAASLGLLLITSSGLAGTKETSTSTYQKIEAATDVPADAQFTPEFAKQILERAKSTKTRSPASLDGVGEDLVKEDVAELRTKLAAVTTPEALDAIIIDFDARYPKLSNDAKWVTIQLSLYQGWKSFLYRIKPYVETKNTRAVHSFLLTALKTTYSQERVGYPSPDWSAGFEYAAQPMKGMGPQVMNDSEFAAMLKEWEARYELAVARTKALDLTTPAVFDNQLLYGKGAFTDGLRRFSWVGEAERVAFLSTLYAGWANLDMMLAYRWENILGVAQSVSQTAGIDVVRVWSDVQGSPAKQRVAAIKTFGSFGQILGDGVGASYMAKAWTNIVSGAAAADTAWTLVKNRPVGDSQVLDTEWWSKNATVTDKNVTTMNDLAAGKTVTLTSMLTGETTRLNLRAFFGKSAPSDLKAFLPTTFVDESHPSKELGVPCGTEKCKKTVGAQTLEFRNWDYGRAIGWNESAYRAYFPDVTSSTGPGKVIRILDQSAGSGTLGWFFNFVGL